MGDVVWLLGTWKRVAACATATGQLHDERLGVFEATVEALTQGRDADVIEALRATPLRAERRRALHDPEAKLTIALASTLVIFVPERFRDKGVPYVYPPHEAVPLVFDGLQALGVHAAEAAEYTQALFEAMNADPEPAP